MNYLTGQDLFINPIQQRAIERFPEEFMFQLTVEEKNRLVTICHRFASILMAGSDKKMKVVTGFGRHKDGR